MNTTQTNQEVKSNQKALDDIRKFDQASLKMIAEWSQDPEQVALAKSLMK